MAASEATILVFVNNDGEVVAAKNLDGSDVKHDPDDLKAPGFKPMVGSHTKLYTSSGCCWRLVNGVWKCRAEYCT